MQVIASPGQTLWEQYAQPDGLYLIESGSLRATYAFEDYPRLVSETMVAGTIAGELSTLSDTSRNATAVAERECVLWKLDQAALEKLQDTQPDVARRFVKILLKGESDYLGGTLTNCSRCGGIRDAVDTSYCHVILIARLRGPCL